MKEGWFLKNTQKLGLDIGCGTEPITDEVQKWDYILGSGDATLMEGVMDETFDYVFSSHCLEHLADPVTALRNWWRILRPGGKLILVLPHRNLYEKKKLLPSRFNPDHKWFYLPCAGEPPHTLGLLETLQKAIGNDFIFQHLIVLDDGYHAGAGPFEHPQGELSIELIVKKPCNLF